MTRLIRALVGAGFLMAVVPLNTTSAEPGAETPPATPSPPSPQFTPPPPAPPSQIDPGILKQPDHLPPPNPEAVVPPPVVDPKMAIDPEKPNQEGSGRPIPTPPSLPR
ncbi:MAG: hypothetical protein E6R14_06855 [Thermomicrobiales bacterium]|nr:MAG: hypothetical protein E6R14_06855 [Thermomicrobiales bacterium]